MWRGQQAEQNPGLKIVFDPLIRAEVTEPAVGPVLVVVDEEAFNDHPGLAQIEQEFPIKALVMQPGVEALDPGPVEKAID